MIAAILWAIYIYTDIYIYIYLYIYICMCIINIIQLLVVEGRIDSTHRVSKLGTGSAGVGINHAHNSAKRDCRQCKPVVLGLGFRV